MIIHNDLEGRLKKIEDEKVAPAMAMSESRNKTGLVCNMKEGSEGALCFVLAPYKCLPIFQGDYK